MCRLLLSMSFLCALMLLPGCAQSPEPGPTTIPEVDHGRLVGVQMALKTDGELAGETIRVAVQGGTVTLEGAVQTSDEKQRAEKIAAGVRGVDKVDNKLTIRGGP
jgi:hypothetical protein